MTSNLKIVSIFVLILQIFLSGCVNKISLVDMSVLNGRKQALANHINTITKKQYITYDLDDKPDSVGSYLDSTYFFDLDINNLLSDGITLYAPDESDSDQDNFKESWEIDQERIEVLDPTNIFDATKVLSDEIQTAKDLITDFITPSTNNDIYQNPEAIETLYNLLTQIKDHSALLSSKAKKYSDDYNSNNQKIKYASDALRAYFLLQLAAVNNKLQSEDTFLLQSLKLYIEGNNFSVKLNDNNHSNPYPYIKPEDAAKIINKYGGLLLDFLNTPLFNYEDATQEFYGYTDTQWKALRDVDNGVTTKALEKATIDMARALQLPTTRGDALFLGFGLLKKVKDLNKVNLKDVKEFIAQTKVLKDQAGSISEYGRKYFAKNPAKVVNNINCFNAKASNTSAAIDCLHTLGSKMIGLKYNKSLGEHYINSLRCVPMKNVLNKISETTRSKLSSSINNAAKFKQELIASNLMSKLNAPTQA